MHRTSAVSMYAGDGGRRGRPSVSSLEGLRNALRNDTESDCAPVAAAAAPVTQAASPGPAAPVGAGDDKQTLRGLNTRMTGYMDRAKQLHEDNDNLRKQIDDILAKRKAPVGRDWDETQNNLEDLSQKIKDITMDNARLMMEAGNTKLANEDWNNKLDVEKHFQKVLEKDLENAKKAMEENKMSQETIKEEINLLKDEIDRLQKEHMDAVTNLCEKIRSSEVNVEIEPENNSLPSSLDNIRRQYAKLAEKNLKETEDWYNKKVDNIKVVEAQNTEALQSGKVDIKDKLKEKQKLEMLIQSLLITIRNLEEVLKKTKVECGQRLGSINNVVVSLEAEVMTVRSQVEHQAQNNKTLVGVKMKLEEEIRKYQELIDRMTGGDSLELSLPDAVKSDEQKASNKELK